MVAWWPLFRPDSNRPTRTMQAISGTVRAGLDKVNQHEASSAPSQVLLSTRPNAGRLAKDRRRTLLSLRQDTSGSRAVRDITLARQGTTAHKSRRHICASSPKSLAELGTTPLHLRNESIS